IDTVLKPSVFSTIPKSLIERIINSVDSTEIDLKPEIKTSEAIDAVQFSDQEMHNILQKSIELHFKQLIEFLTENTISPFNTKKCFIESCGHDFTNKTGFVEHYWQRHIDIKFIPFAPYTIRYNGESSVCFTKKLLLQCFESRGYYHSKPADILINITWWNICLKYDGLSLLIPGEHFALCKLNIDSEPKLSCLVDKESYAILPGYQDNIEKNIRKRKVGQEHAHGTTSKNNYSVKPVFPPPARRLNNASLR
ncbi:MAG: hypothetical protein ACHQVS_05490, partial [Candidatus Babeliales bacterium]